jgi:hypothetical protein
VTILILTKPREKGKKKRDGKIKGREKRGKGKREKKKKMGEMVGDQTTNQAANPLRRGKKNPPVLEQ